MDGYPTGSLDHNVPFIVATGLNSTTNELPLSAELKDQAILLRSELPLLEGKEVEVLEEYFEEITSKGTSWTGFSKEESYRFRIKSVGRSFLLPPRRARLPDDIEPRETNPALHSPFSPLSPVSRLYPDGHIDAQWLQKHQELVPSVFVSFYSLTSDPSSATLTDNGIKTDISHLKAALARSGYKSRLAVVLLGESDEAPLSLADGVQQRLENIRKGTALDPKSVFYIPPQESPAELRRVIDNIFGVLYTTAVEYYRDLGRHARKKRSRGIAPQPTVPPTSGTSQTLSLPDWNFRYDFKSAVFAEFRQEIDAALRSFEQAYETLLGPDVLDIIPSWSPRWNEARSLSDIISIRCLRCHLWMGQTTLAVRRWQSHRDRIGEVVDRRGRGTNNYGWQAWEARWAMVMANLMEKMEIPSLAPSTGTLFLQPEKAVMTDRLQPWELLHHTGYWYRIAARHLGARRNLARTIPEEDRNPPDVSPASRLANKGYSYDTYMCPEPYEEYPNSGEGVNHSRLIIDCLKTAIEQFKVRKQLRIVAELSVECSRECVHLGLWEEAIETLRPLWEARSFREEGWVGISEDLCWLMRRAAIGAQRADLAVAADWELMNKKFSRRPQWHYDISRTLDGTPISPKPSVQLSDDTTCSFISSSFVFRHKEGKAGETSTAQLTLISDAFSDATPIAFESLKVNFGGHLKPIFIEHESSKESEQSSKHAVNILPITLTEEFSDDSDDEDTPSFLRGQADLTLNPGQTYVLELEIPLREPGEAVASSVVLSHRNEAFDLDYTLKYRESDQVTGWYVQGSRKPRNVRPNANTLQIQPRPPKMEIKLVESPAQYYANEAIELLVELVNAEEESASVKLDIHLFGTELPILRVQPDGHDERTAEAAAEESIIPAIALGSIDSSSSLKLIVSLEPASKPIIYDLHLKASYHLASDAATTVVQMLPIQLNVVNAFEANYDLVPRIHPDPWPSLFDHEGVGKASDDDALASGLIQKWCLLCHYASFAQQDLKVVDVELTILSCTGGGRCSVAKKSEISEEGLVVAPKTMHEAQFDLTVQKLTLDDRHPVTLDLAFAIKWQRQGSSDNPINTTTMPPGKYLTLSSEPRVLASVYHSPPEESDLVQLDITLENPSNHFLTFGLSMEPSDEFAFSGGKSTTLNLLPMSRRTTTYRMLPLVRGKYVRPGLVVRDKYFQKTLRIIPTEGMKIDKDGLLIWVPGNNDDDEDEESG